MKAAGPKFKQALAKVAAVLQVCIGALLLVGTIGLTLTAYKTVRYESEQITQNLTAAGDALESLRETYGQSADNLFGLAGPMDDISTKLDGVSAALYRIGGLFPNVWPVKGVGEKWKDVSSDVESIAEAVKKQSKTIERYRDDGHEKTLNAMTKTIESIRHTAQMLDGANSAGRWCGFVCVLGFCVSMLFFTNGVLLFLLARNEKGKETP